MSRDTEKMTDLEDGEIIQTYSIEGDSLKLESATEPIMETFNVEGENGTRLIQSYLDNFNREIQSNDTTMQVAEEDVVNEGDPGTLFIDQDGRYYFQASAPAVTEKVQDEQILSDEASTQVLINSESYQALTLVPSETLNGEVSYVLIVQQPDDKESEGNKETEADMTVYDFNENEEEVLEEIEGNSGPEDDKSKILKLPLKKSQVVAQAHMCSYCNYTSPKRYLLSRHMKSHSEERPHKCTVCERGFKTLASLQNHVNTHTGTKPHRCRFCDSAFTTSGELVRHVRYRHTHEKPHKCRECEYASVELSKLKRHVRCHTGERPYQCPHCTYASPDTFKLKRHLRTHTGEKPYQCDDCLLCFTQSNSLKAHKLTHNLNDKPIYPCELCPTTCGRKTDLRIHVQKLHTSDKPLKCKRCGKSFPDRYSFKLHNKTHEGEKCFKCEMCPYASISLRHLSSHMLIHTDEKPFACELCDQTFRQKQLLKRHQNLYHNPDYVPPCPREKSHECQECGRQFRHKGNLIRHMAIHDPESTVHEKTMALKLGRQKKIHIIGGQSVEVMHGGADSDESDDAPGAIEEQPETEELEEQQYVVLQVIHLDGNESSEQTFIQGQILETDYVEEETVPALQSSKSMELAALKMADTDKDMANCFGFDDEEAEEEETMVVEEEEEDVEKDMEDPLTI